MTQDGEVLWAGSDETPCHAEHTSAEAPSRNRVGTNLASREKRLRLKIGKRHSVDLADGLHLVYRRAVTGDASWSVRQRDAHGRYPLRRLGAADDATHPDGITVLSFEQAVDLARTSGDAEPGTPAPNTLIVKQACDRYLKWYREHRKGVVTADSAIRIHILPALGHRPVCGAQGARTHRVPQQAGDHGAAAAHVEIRQRDQPRPRAGDGRRQTAATLDGEQDLQRVAGGVKQGFR